MEQEYFFRDAGFCEPFELADSAFLHLAGYMMIVENSGHGGGGRLVFGLFAFLADGSIITSECSPSSSLATLHPLLVRTIL